MALFMEKKTHNSKEAPKNGKILLVDADTVCFHSILQCTDEEILMDRNFYSDEAWEILTKEEGFNEHTNTCRHLNFEQAKKAFDYKIESLLLATGCESAEFFVTGWLYTFRHFLDPKYKSDRKGGQRPLRLAEFKWYLVQERKAYISGYFEADEVLARKYLNDPDKYMVATVDKDLLLQLPGKHFDYYSKRFHITNTSKADAIYNFHHRLLMGDRGDYILTGLVRVGEKTATKILAKTKSLFDKHMQLTEEEPTEVELMMFKESLYEDVRKEYIRQDKDTLYLMFNMVGADYMSDTGFVPMIPDIINIKCPFCKEKKKEGELQCGKHTLPEVPRTMPFLIDKMESTHLLENGQKKYANLYKLYKEMIAMYQHDIEADLLDMERFYLFVSHKIGNKNVYMTKKDLSKPLGEYNIEFEEI